MDNQTTMGKRDLSCHRLTRPQNKIMRVELVQKMSEKCFRSKTHKFMTFKAKRILR